MLMLKVIGDPEKVRAALKTNRPMAHGQVISGGDESKARAFAAAHPDLVDLIDPRARLEDLVDPRQVKDAAEDERAVAAKAAQKAKSNKMLHQQPGRFKSKSFF